MKNSFLMKAFVCLFTVVALCSCSKDDDEETIADNTITAKVENGSSYNDKIDAVKALIYSENKVELASSTYSNGGFTLKLPATVSDTYLVAVYDSDDLADFEDFEDIEDGVTVSNPNIKMEIINISAYKSGEEIGEFYYGTSDGLYYVDYVYSNGDVSITGTGTIIDRYDYNNDGDYDDDSDIYEIYTYNYNVHLKQGWNIVYYKDVNEYEEEITTQTPSVTLKWYYDDYSSSSTQGVRAKKVPSLLSKSKIRL